MQTETAMVMDASTYRPERSRSNTNGLASRQRILKRCRELMAEGVFRPSRRDMCVGIITLKTMKYHFPSLDDLYYAALDQETAAAIAHRVTPDPNRLALAVVFGRLRT